MTVVSAYERVIERLVDFTGYQPARDGAEWRCPAHGDKKPSLSVTAKGDRVLIHCQAGCDLADVLNALKLEPSDLFDGPKSNGNGKKEWTPRGDAEAVYQYVDENGYTLFEVCRTADKEFPLRVPDPSMPHGYRWQLGDARRVIYRLPKVIEAVKQGWPVWIVEGEKDVHALESAGEVATCNPGGAEKWKPEYAQWFEGAQVFIVADKDAPGRRHARRVAASMEGHASKVVIVEAVTGKDATDHLNAGRTVAEFLRIRDDEVFAGETQQEPVVLARPFVPVALDIDNKPEPRSTIGDFLYRSGLTVLQAEPGVGKTWVALWIAIQVLRRGGQVLYFDEEGGEDLARERLYALGADNALISGRLHYFPFEARKWDSEDLKALEVLVEPMDDTIAIFDSLPDFLAAAGWSEDKAQDVTTFVNDVLGRLRSAGIAQLVLDHMRKPDAGKSKADRSRYSRGSSAKLAKADATVLLETAQPFDAKTSGQLRYWKTKDRYGRLPLPRLDQPGALLAFVVDDGRVGLEPIAPSEEQEWSGPTECMAVVLDTLNKSETSSLSAKDFHRMLSFRPQTIDEALGRLTMEGTITFTHGPRNTSIYRLKVMPGEFDFGEAI